MARNFLAFLSASLLSVSCVLAGVEIKSAGDTHHIKTDAYTADIAADGALTSIVYKGQELLKPGVNVSRGMYCFQNGVLALKKVEQPNDSTVVATADGKPTVTYGFEASSINISLANTTQARLQFFIVLDPTWNVVGNSGGEIVKTPIRRPWENSTWYAGDKQAKISGSTATWGPWMEHFNIIESDIAPGQTRKLTVELADVSAADALQVASVREGKIIEPALAIESPKPWQVFQRRSQSTGFVRVCGHVKANADSVQVRITGKSIQGDLPDKWQILAVDPATHLFNADVPTSAGGWYAVEVQAKAGDKVVAGTRFENVGVGEVFVIAGQSNSTNFGDKRIEPTSGLASTFDGSSWRIASDPQPGTSDGSSGGSPWAPFADAMVEHYHVPVAVASTGAGGTSINAWQPDTELFRHMLGRIHELGYLGFRAVLWHQGESDCDGMSTDEYSGKLEKVINASRLSAGWDFPWFVAKATYHAKDKIFKSIRDAQQNLWDQAIALEGPDTDTLRNEMRDANGGGIHLSEKGLRAHGKLWQEKVSVWLDKVLESPSKNNPQ